MEWRRITPVFSGAADELNVSQQSAKPARVRPHPSDPKHLKGKDPKQLRFVARQPIFDREEKVFGYELLFRNGLENSFVSADADAANEASRATLDSSLLMGLNVLCDGKRAFVNCTRDTLIKGLVTLLPSQSTVVEILESVPADPDVIGACGRLKEAGYLIALDDYVADDPREPLADMADIIKVELKLTTVEQRVALIKRYGPWRCRMLAEKVETQAEFAAARDQGFVYFQGYFFRRPEMLATHDMPANHLNYLRMLQAVSRPDLDLPAIEELIKGEASICYRLLRYLNSAVFGFNSEIHSVRHALSILGEREVRRWVRLVAAVGAGQDKTSDLVLSALVRARFGELLGPKVPHGESDLFLLGLLSLIDAMLEMPMAEVLEQIPLDRETKAVLLGQSSLLRPIYQSMLAHESGEWEAAAKVGESLHLDAEEVAGLYWQAQRWAREVSTAA
ncbi:MAG TPA: HDOD domain-containing protein [Candidatus Sulfotelmatobacter sp.]|nr:HDOD domain-containing protein [Candidatus Sulfotelmatobacter sp.]